MSIVPELAVILSIPISDRLCFTPQLSLILTKYKVHHCIQRLKTSTSCFNKLCDHHTALQNKGLGKIVYEANVDIY